ncbi:hypothetical protein [uncultured Celeribacter sp.]|uniref:hypothetical protein n=1 Tax=uncultured Celeribacter sp. TaxID=1303376 RepID=UPI002AA7437B|nr:hypothetical protein [uncultured Celeribacter sp.]
MAGKIVVPSSLMDIAETFGLGVVAKLMQHYGGQEVEFPQRPKEGHELISLLGEEQANALCHYLSGARLYIPHGRSNQKKLDVDKLYRSGMKRNQIAKTLSISQRHVRRLASDDPPDQMPLFPDEI